MGTVERVELVGKLLVPVDGSPQRGHDGIDGGLALDGVSEEYDPTYDITIHKTWAKGVLSLTAEDKRSIRLRKDIVSCIYDLAERRNASTQASRRARNVTSLSNVSTVFKPAPTRRRTRPSCPRWQVEARRPTLILRRSIRTHQAVSPAPKVTTATIGPLKAMPAPSAG